MDINGIIMFSLIALQIILNSFGVKYSFVISYVIIWYAICMLANHTLFT